MGRAPRLLYINNDADVAADRAETLSSEYELTVHTASGVTTAKAVLSSKDIDCVVSEFRLGDADGFDLLSHVRSEHGSLPVILLIDDAPENIARDAFESGATDLFPRSMLELSYDPLVDRIHEILDTPTEDSTGVWASTSDDSSEVAAASTPTANSDPERTISSSTVETTASTDGGGTEAVASSSSPVDTPHKNTEGADSNESSDAANREEVDAISELDLAELRELSKDELIALLAKIIGDDDELVTGSVEQMAETIETTDDPESQTTQTAAETAGESEGSSGSASVTSNEPEPAIDDAEPTIDSVPAGTDVGTAAPGVDDASTPKSNTTETAAVTPKADETAWETDEGYHRPAGLNLTPGTTILVQCGSQDDRKHDARRDLLGLTEADDRNVLLIQYRAMNTDRLAAIATAAKRVKVITVGCSQTVPNAVSDTIEVVHINNPNDVTRLGILSTKTIDAWQSLDGGIAVSLDPLGVLFRYKSVEGTFRFLHIFLGKLSTAGAVSSLFVNPSASSPQDVNTLKPLFDHILTVDGAGVDLEGT